MENKEDIIKRIDECLKYEKENPEDVNVKRKLGDLYYKLDEYEKSIELYKKVLEIKPDDYGSMNSIGNSFSNLEKYEESIEWYKKALDIKPDFYNAIFNIGFSYGDLGKYEEAIEWYKKSLEINPNDYETIFNIGFSYSILDKYKEAIEWYKKALEMKPDLYEAMNNLGNLYYDLDKYDDSIDWYKKALITNPDGYEAINNLLELYIEQNNIDELVAIYNKNLKNNKISKYYMCNFKIACFLKDKGENIRLSNAPKNYVGKITDVIEIFSVGRYSKYLNKFNNINISEDCIDCKEHMIVKIIFEKTKNISSNKKKTVREYLIKLYKQIIDIKEKLRFKRNMNNVDNVEICNYAKLGNVKKIIIKEKDKDNYIVDFRFSNVAYMNDPQEGKVFPKLIKNNKKKDIDLVEEKKKNQVVYKSNTYLGCFSKKINELPLWVQYTNNGEGCCLVFNKNIFDEKEDYCCSQIKFDMMKSNSSDIVNYDKKDGKDVSIDKQISDNDTLDNNNTKETQKYVLYNVAYVDKDNNIYVDGNLIDNLSACFEKIPKYMDEINKIKIKNEEDKKNIEVIVNDILDQVKFLFKDKAYEHEQELRVIKFSDKPEVDDNYGEVPKLYLKFDRDIEFERAVLGPRIGEAKYIAQYLYHSEKVKEVSYSDIEYR